MSGELAIDEVRAALEGERASLRVQLAELGFGDEGGLDYDANFADSSQVTAERGEAEALAAQLGEHLEEVDHALSKVADGTYGSCEKCGERIAAPRLEAMPSTRFCIEHASKR